MSMFEGVIQPWFAHFRNKGGNSERGITNWVVVVTSTRVGGQQKPEKHKNMRQRLWRRLVWGWCRRRNRWSPLLLVCLIYWYYSLGSFVFRQSVRAHGGDERRGSWEKERKRVVISADRAYFLSTVSGRWVYVIILLPRKVSQLFSLRKNISVSAQGRGSSLPPFQLLDFSILK